jgi:hypothetical protein
MMATQVRGLNDRDVKGVDGKKLGRLQGNYMHPAGPTSLTLTMDLVRKIAPTFHGDTDMYSLQPVPHSKCNYKSYA